MYKNFLVSSPRISKFRLHRDLFDIHTSTIFVNTGDSQYSEDSVPSRVYMTTPKTETWTYSTGGHVLTPFLRYLLLMNFDGSIVRH